MPTTGSLPRITVVGAATSWSIGGIISAGKARVWNKRIRIKCAHLTGIVHISRPFPDITHRIIYSPLVGFFSSNNMRSITGVSVIPGIRAISIVASVVVSRRTGARRDFPHCFRRQIYAEFGCREIYKRIKFDKELGIVRCVWGY